MKMNLYIRLQFIAFKLWCSSLSPKEIVKISSSAFISFKLYLEDYTESGFLNCHFTLFFSTMILFKILNWRYFFNPGLERSPGEGYGNPLHYSCQENSMDSRAWWATIHGVAKSCT